MSGAKVESAGSVVEPASPITSVPPALISLPASPVALSSNVPPVIVMSSAFRHAAPPESRQTVTVPFVAVVSSRSSASTSDSA